jgi:hypothetical protein
MTISSEGFDPVRSVVQLKPGAKLDLGMITLQRAYGQWAVSSLPAHCRYTLTGAAATGNFVKSGTTPDLVSDLPSGTYQLNVSTAKFAPWSETIQIPPHAMKTERIDLIAASLLGKSNDPAARVFRGESPVASLTASEKMELINYYNRAFALYIGEGLLAPAAQQVRLLQELNADVGALQSTLAASRSAKEAEIAASMSRLISDKKLASAADLLQRNADELDAESTARLDSLFQPILAPYREKIDLLLRSLPSGAPALAQTQLAPAMAQYPDDIRLQLRAAQLLAQLPPNHGQLVRQLEALHRLADPGSEFVSNPDLVAVVGTLQDELGKLNTLSKAVNDAKAALDDENDKIAHLQNQKEAYENRRVGRRKTNPFASTLNFFGKVVTGHSVVGTEAVFATQEDKEDAISSVQQEIEVQQLTLPSLQQSLADAQKSYDDFISVVPWGRA